MRTSQGLLTPTKSSSSSTTASARAAAASGESAGSASAGAGCGNGASTGAGKSAGDGIHTGAGSGDEDEEGSAAAAADMAAAGAAQRRGSLERKSVFDDGGGAEHTSCVPRPSKQRWVQFAVSSFQRLRGRQCGECGNLRKCVCLFVLSGCWDGMGWDGG
jgi:hypothetical protein